MSDTRRLRRNRENRKNLFKRRLEDIERQEREQQLKREERRAASQRTITSVESILESPKYSQPAGRTSSRVENDDKTQETERIDRTTTRSGRLKSPPSWISKNKKPPPDKSSRFESRDIFAVRTTRQGNDEDKKWEHSSYDPVPNERRKRSRMMPSPETNLNVSRTRSRYEVSQSPTIVATATPEAAKLKPKAPTEGIHGSDSDGSFDMLALFQKNKEQCRKAKEGTNDDDEDHSAQLDDDDSYDDKKRPSMRRPRPRNIDTTSDDDSTVESCSGDFDDENYDNKNRNRNKYRTKCSKPLRKKRTRRRDYSSSDDDWAQSYNDNKNYRKRSPTRRRRTHKPKNPVALERESHNLFFSVATGAKGNDRKTPPPSREDDDDGFMSDCEPIDPKPKKTTATSTYNKHRSPPEESNSISRKRGKSSEKQRPRMPASSDESSENDYNGRKEQNKLAGSLDDWHPEFEDPKFGPYEPMEPLVLSGDQSEITVQVPASLNRYLAPFQKAGVRFMYDCLARKSGVILGDEMGCGKTVQVIALLCALFGKTGTMRDFENMRERNYLVRKQKSKIQKLRDQALRKGEVVDENIEEWKKASFSLSLWNPVMIIVPPTIVDTWKNAFITFSHFSVSFYSSKTKADAIESVLYGNSDILIVPKSAFQNETHFAELERVHWKLLVIDEFHNFKNDKAKISIHLRKLKALHHPLILGMTGTPMQNNHKELWNLVDLVETNYFGTQEEFNMNFDRPITLGRQKSANARVKARSEAASAELRRELSKIYIKREKKDVLKDQLPEKNEQMILCDLSPLQKEVYKLCIELPDFDLVKHGSRPCDCGINQNFFRNLSKLKSKAEQLEYMRTNKTQIVNQAKCCRKIPENPRHELEGEPYIDPDAAIWRTLDAHCTDRTVAKEGCKSCPWCCTLPCLTKLNKLSSHLGLLQATTTNEPVGSPAYIRYIKEREFAKVSLAGVASKLPGGGYDRNDGIMDDHFALSGKLRVLERLLQKYYNEGGKVLLFSHSTQSLGLIQNWLKSRGTYEYRRMDGSTPVSRRQQLTDEFNDDDHIFLFLLSIKATGLGLNLTSANRVIMFDVSWNPSWEIQAQDRAHRIGQKRDVHVVRLISRGTVEEMIYLRQIYKIHLKQDTLQDHDDVDAVAPRVFRGVQGDKYRKGEIFGTENLFRFKKDGSFLDDIWAESRSKEKRDSNGLEIHDSRKLSEVLLEMTDKDKVKVRDEDDEVVIQEMLGGNSEEFITKSDTFSKERNTNDHEETICDSDRDNHFRDESLEKTVRAVNHGDLFRSDKGGAAITSGEDGFDEEMGGQTQAAYEIYENVKDVLVNEDESGATDDDIVDDESIEIDNTKEKGNDDNNDIVTSFGQFKHAARMETDVSGPHEISMNTGIPKKPNDAVKLEPTDMPISDQTTLSRNVGSKSSNSFNFDKESNTNAVPSSTYRVHHSEKNHGLVKNSANQELPKSGIQRNRTKTKHKVLLMGHTDIDSVKTMFSMTDIRRPNYGKKKGKHRSK